MDENWNSTLIKYQTSKYTKYENIRKYTDSDVIRHKAQNLALDRSDLAPEKKAELRKIREKRKQILMSKITKIQDSIAKYTFKLKPITDNDIY